MKIKPHGEERKQVKNLLHEVEGAITDEAEIEDYNYLNDLGVDNNLHPVDDIKYCKDVPYTGEREWKIKKKGPLLNVNVGLKFMGETRNTQKAYYLLIRDQRDTRI